MDAHITTLIIQSVLLTLLALTAWVIARTNNLFSAAFLTSILSILAAAIFLLLEAPDVAFTEAAVGAGLSTILFLTAISASDYPYAYNPVRKLGSMMVSLIVGWMIYYSMWDLPVLGSFDAPSHNHISAYYLAKTSEQIGIPNVVTAILASYRGFDTLGEVSVIFVAGIGAMVILNSIKDKE